LRFPPRLVCPPSIVFGEDHFTTDKIETAASLTGYTYHTLYNCNYVARNVPFSRRRESLSWSHHYEVASLDGDEQEKWLLAAETHGLSHKALRASIRIGEVVTDAQLSAGGLKVNAPVSLAGLGLKLRLLQSRTKVEEMDRGQLEEAEKNLRPFVDFHHRIQELLTTNGQPDAS
jgi:hypothetical protein